MPTGSGFVVDASVSAAWFLPDEATADTEAALKATSTHDVWVPSLWLLEIGNLLLNAQRRRRISADKRRQLVRSAADLRLRVDREAVSMATLDELASAYGLSSYDATYLELADRRRLRLATLDVALTKAMGSAGIEAPALA